MAESTIDSDKCWVENHRNDSRKWIVNMDTYDPHPTSTMKREYLTPRVKLDDANKRIGKRRELLLNQLRVQMAQDILNERAEHPPVEEYCTTYDCNFTIPGFTVNETISEDSELHRKYPLYGPTTVNFWQKDNEDERTCMARLAGMTKAVNPLQPFRRNSSFSTRVKDRLDEPDF